MTKYQNLTLKAAVGSVAPPQPDGTFHCHLIPYGYAVVTVDGIMEGFEELGLDHPTGEGENQLVNALRSTCLWRKPKIDYHNKRKLVGDPMTALNDGPFITMAEVFPA